ncbi:MAG: hypothetical protein HQL17_00440 [Candidatus Omnitrophica bacterium]|nr:hypothetical protein [Candidatus Omnitrophota bacterium]
MMKNFMLVAALLFVSTGLSMAQPAAAKASVPAVIAVAGKIQAVTEADVAKGTKSEVVIDVNGVAKTVLIKKSTTIYDVNAKPLMLKDLKKDELIKVNCKASAEGVLEAVSIYQAK